MKTEQRKFNGKGDWELVWWESGQWANAQLVLVFWNRTLLSDGLYFNQLKQIYPKSHVVAVSDSGTIIDTMMVDDSMVSTAVYFEKSSVSFVAEPITDKSQSYEVWKVLWSKLEGNQLRHIMVFSEGINVNGSELIKGIKEKVPSHVSLSWWLAGDDMRFEKTFVSLDEWKEGRQIILVWFYGENLKVWFWSIWGWDTFGLKRTITKSDGNILYEIDGKPALDLYKTYLWELAAELPGSGLLFPLSIKSPDSSTILVRTLLWIDEATKSITFAGDVPEWYEACLMKANFERIIDGAGQAAKNGIASIQNPELAILISCVWRKAILKQRVEEEIENVRHILWNTPTMTWFYSYWEIAPSGDLANCYLHNQTMTVTLFQES